MEGGPVKRAQRLFCFVFVGQISIAFGLQRKKITQTSSLSEAILVLERADWSLWRNCRRWTEIKGEQIIKHNKKSYFFIIISGGLTKLRALFCISVFGNMFRFTYVVLQPAYIRTFARSCWQDIVWCRRPYCSEVFQEVLALCSLFCMEIWDGVPAKYKTEIDETSFILFLW